MEYVLNIQEADYIAGLALTEFSVNIRVLNSLMCEVVVHNSSAPCYICTTYKICREGNFIYNVEVTKSV